MIKMYQTIPMSFSLFLCLFLASCNAKEASADVVGNRMVTGVGNKLCVVDISKSVKVLKGNGWISVMTKRG